MTRAWPISREGYKKATLRLLVFIKRRKESYGSKIDWLCPGKSLKEEDSR
jgi:hypothetical protein